jgi:hypothetical protein
MFFFFVCVGDTQLLAIHAIYDSHITLHDFQ